MTRLKTCLKNIKKPKFKFTLEDLLFSSAIKIDTEKIFVTTSGLTDAKYGLINRKLYQTIGEIKNWNEIKKSSRWVNVKFQAQSDKRDAKHFSYNFVKKHRGRA